MAAKKKTTTITTQSLYLAVIRKYSVVIIQLIEGIPPNRLLGIDIVNKLHAQSIHLCQKKTLGTLF